MFFRPSPVRPDPVRPGPVHPGQRRPFLEVLGARWPAHVPALVSVWLLGWGGGAIAQVTSSSPHSPANAPIGIPTHLLAGEAEELCSTPALARLRRHTVVAGETLESIASRYGLTAATVMGFNGAVRGGRVTAGQTLIVPPYNGIQVATGGRSWAKLSTQYKVRSDVLFEVNGCVTQPTMAFVPGVKWVPGIEAAGVTIAGATSSTPADETAATLQDGDRANLSGYPLGKPGTLVLKYGSNLDPSLNRVAFHGGVDIAVPLGEAVLSIGEGTVAYVGEQGEYGNLIVINHADGLQSRYAQLGSLKVVVGQRVDRNTVIGTVGQTGTPSTDEPHLHFEIRVNSALGWVAQDPMPFLGDR